MFEYDENILADLSFIMLYPPEGESSVLEVSAEVVGPFLHVMLASDETLVFAFISTKPVILSEKQFSIICEKAKEKLSLTDYSRFES